MIDSAMLQKLGIRGVNKMKDLRVCRSCGREFERNEMLFTTDCYGIPFRLVCMECYEELMKDGYDGQRYYAGIDECIDEDY